MTAKLLYTKAGSDPSTILWPDAGPPYERWLLTDGVVRTIHELIGFPHHVEFADGRMFPSFTAQGSKMLHQKDK
jgi:hypothetical protein